MRKFLSLLITGIFIISVLTGCGKGEIRAKAIQAVRTMALNVSNSGELVGEDKLLKEKLNDFYGTSKYTVKYFVNDNEIRSIDYEFNHKDNFKVTVKPDNDDYISWSVDIKRNIKQSASDGKQEVAPIALFDFKDNSKASRKETINIDDAAVFSKETLSKLKEPFFTEKELGIVLGGETFVKEFKGEEFADSRGNLPFSKLTFEARLLKVGEVVPKSSDDVSYSEMHTDKGSVLIKVSKEYQKAN